MTDPIKQIADQLGEILRRLHALETAPRAPHTSVRNGYTRWMLDGEAENPKLFIGTDEGGEDVSLRLNDEDGGAAEIFVGTVGGRARFEQLNDDGGDHVLQLADGVMITPQIATGWQRDGFHNVDTSGRPTTTSGTYDTPMWRTLLPCTAGSVFGSIDVAVGAGITSAAVIVQASVFGGGVGAQTVHEETGITTTVNFDDVWAIPTSVLSPAASPIGQLLEVTVSGRVTGGAGTLAVIPRLPLVNWPS